MAHRIRNTALIALILIAALSLTGAFAENPPAAPATVRDLNEQTVMGLAWMQKAAEYRELCYQAYNLATMIVDKAIASAKPGDQPLAIISDLDESLLDNSAYDVGFIGTNEAFSGKTWTQWENAVKAEAMPGAAEFLTGIAQRKVEVFYVTNRDMPGLEGTIRNLQALGFPFADVKHVLVSTGSSDKQPRFDMVAKDFHVVLYMGDNANDLPIGTYHKNMKDRNAIVDQNR
ncbi:MAG TPA: HAD family acid phosphatase, partial [Rectinemataceae bacterium]|nr:HAD family acid phosphatase [Rectinemataceae bacterium]